MSLRYMSRNCFLSPEFKIPESEAFKIQKLWVSGDDTPLIHWLDQDLQAGKVEIGIDGIVFHRNNSPSSPVRVESSFIDLWVKSRIYKKRWWLIWHNDSKTFAQCVILKKKAAKLSQICQKLDFFSQHSIDDQVRSVVENSFKFNLRVLHLETTEDHYDDIEAEQLDVLTACMQIIDMHPKSYIKALLSRQASWWHLDVIRTLETMISAPPSDQFSTTWPKLSKGSNSIFVERLTRSTTWAAFPDQFIRGACQLTGKTADHLASYWPGVQVTSFLLTLARPGVAKHFHFVFLVPAQQARELYNLCGHCQAKLSKLPKRELFLTLKGFHPDEIELRQALTPISILGRGQFGEVYQSSMNCSKHQFIHQPVAVKMLKQGCTVVDKRDFQREVDILPSLQHKNIVIFVSSVRQQMPWLVVIEIMRHGDLRRVVQTLHGQNQHLNPREILLFASQICQGLVFLSARNIVHMDIAARNCLLGDDNLVKICDFGLARHLTVDEKYYKCDEPVGKMPLKWMPHEAMSNGIFSLESDIWAYGVVIWELFSNGETPWGKRRGAEVQELVQNKKRLQQPELCPDDIFNDICTACWTQGRDERPSAKEMMSVTHRLFLSYHAMTIRNVSLLMLQRDKSAVCPMLNQECIDDLVTFEEPEPEPADDSVNPKLESWLDEYSGCFEPASVKQTVEIEKETGLAIDLARAVDASVDPNDGQIQDKNQNQQKTQIFVESSPKSYEAPDRNESDNAEEPTLQNSGTETTMKEDKVTITTNGPKLIVVGPAESQDDSEC